MYISFVPPFPSPGTLCVLCTSRYQATIWPRGILINHLVIVRPYALQIIYYLGIILADCFPPSCQFLFSQKPRYSRGRVGKINTMLGIPPVGPAVVVGKGRLVALERNVGAAHDGLAHVVEAVDHVPVVVVRDRVVRLETRVGLDDGELLFSCLVFFFQRSLWGLEDRKP